MRLFTLMVLLLLLGGCASTEQFQRDMDSYLGWDIVRLREHFGYNYIERDLGDGTRAYTWVWTDRNMRQGYLSPDVIHTYQSADGTSRVIVSPGTYFPPSYDDYQCEMSFIANAEGRVTRWRAQGNGCSLYSGPAPVLEHGVAPPASSAAP